MKQENIEKSELKMSKKWLGEPHQFFEGRCGQCSTQKFNITKFSNIETTNKTLIVSPCFCGKTYLMMTKNVTR